MKISDKLLKKYASVSPLLPPASEEEVVEVEVPVAQNEPAEKWLKLLQEAEGMDPLTEKPAQTEEEILSSLTESAPPPYEQELLKVLRPEHGVAGEDQPTIRPGKKASLSPDALLNMCQTYYEMSVKP